MSAFEVIVAIIGIALFGLAMFKIGYSYGLAARDHR